MLGRPRDRLDSSVIFLGGGGTQKRNGRFLMVLPSKGIWDSGFSSSSLLPHGCELRGLALLHILAMMCLLPYHSMDPNRKEPSIPRVKPWMSEPKLTLYLSTLIALSICCGNGKVNAILVGDSFPLEVRLASLDKHFKSQC